MMVTTAAAPPPPPAMHQAGGVSGRLSLQSYGFLVIFNSLTLFITLVPQLAEYSHNNSVSVGLPWGLGALPGLLQFTNGLVVVYRAVQALREGVEHLVMRNAHGVSAGGAGGAGGGMGVPCVVMATMCVAVYSALGHRRQQYVGLLVAGAWMLGSAILAGERGELVEPLGCILMAVVMALVGIPTCVQEGRILLLASSPSSSDDAAAGDRTEAERVRAVARVPGVVGFEGRTWAVARETYTAVRVEVENDSLAADVLEKTADVIKFTFYVFMPMGFMVYFGGPGFYERYVADETYKFNAPPKVKVPTEPKDVMAALEQLRQAREDRKAIRDKYMSEMEDAQKIPGIAQSSFSSSS
ncbi:hypothetical protein LPJ66_001948 [Kickxella alabastrina]|uniref:Uncharacterized protein n=1 Tax=Kickxella alabastrina TaxID=61397 RepID=A0ACC1IRV6_9FUNG|nr:hypothetical protein LPJ66_001948 [Kickxella alabastrina]